MSLSKKHIGNYEVEYSEVRIGTVTVTVMQEDLITAETLQDAILNAISEDGVKGSDLSVEECSVSEFKKL